MKNFLVIVFFYMLCGITYASGEDSTYTVTVTLAGFDNPNLTVQSCAVDDKDKWWSDCGDVTTTDTISTQSNSTSADYLEPGFIIDYPFSGNDNCTDSNNGCPVTISTIDQSCTPFFTSTPNTNVSFSPGQTVETEEALVPEYIITNPKGGSYTFAMTLTLLGYKNGGPNLTLTDCSDKSE